MKRRNKKRQPFQRTDRVADTLQRELGMILLRDISDPRVSAATVTGVELSPDLKYAKVFVSVLGDEEEQKQAHAALQSAAGFVRKKIGEKVKMRVLPEFQFRLDHSIERGAKMANLLRDLREQREKLDTPELIDALPGMETCLVLAHEHPEGDAIGSSVALGLALEEMGKTVTIYNADPVPGFLRFLPGADRVTSEVPDTAAFDTVFIVDCGAFDRPGPEITEKLRVHRNIVNIDHHVTNERFGRFNVVVPEASSTGEILYDILAEAEHAIRPAVAENLYTAILTDTGSFQNGATTPASLRICADLIEHGVDPEKVATHVYYTYPEKRQRLLGEVLASIVMEADGRVAAAVVTQAMFDKTGTGPEDLEGFVEELRRIEGVNVAILIRERDEVTHKVSMRAKNGPDLARIAAELGGGGHPAAAGCTIEDRTADEVRALLVDRIEGELGG